MGKNSLFTNKPTPKMQKRARIKDCEVRNQAYDDAIKEYEKAAKAVVDLLYKREAELAALPNTVDNKAQRDQLIVDINFLKRELLRQQPKQKLDDAKENLKDLQKTVEKAKEEVEA